jgi:hypothetical protein
VVPSSSRASQQLAVAHMATASMDSSSGGAIAALGSTLRLKGERCFGALRYSQCVIYIYIAR